MILPFRRHREEPAPPPTDDELATQVDEGLLIVMTGLRLTTRNRIVLEALRDRDDFDEDAVVAGVREDAAAIVAEQRAAIAFIDRTRAQAARRHGHALHSADFRRRDVAPLERRARIAALLVERLEERVADEQVVRDLVRAARRSAMDDMFDSALRILDVAPDVVDPDRDDRLASLHEELRTLGLDPAHPDAPAHD
ncbi:hypothetical protein [Agrococcus jejuensis]|uniref:Uncharacterized protein n=1 Tax=Agrococcus jejuensis TaxID=399736 RepID=A0A1G7ZT72_9MICO|nr:hypothetical protein [Agrococcus jejuensis]SDH11888.1 hypothetical protein SAMN04489720_0102 [Agrococcus jejuensis]